MKKQPKAYDRPKQECPSELIFSLLGTIRRQFCADLTDKQWYSCQNFFKRVILYPAKYLNQRGVTLPPKRYQEIVQDILQDIKRHGQTETVKCWHGYLLHCIQQHFEHHGEDYYNEGKSLRAMTERALMGFTRAQEAAQAADPVAPMAQAYAILSRPKRRTARFAKQPDLFAL